MPFLKRVIAGISAAVVISAGAWAQSFEVASVKPHPLRPGQFMFRIPGRGLQVHGDRFTEDAVTVNDLIMEAYGVPEHQISGGPSWAAAPNGDHFDIAAKSAAVPTVRELQEMVQTLLADRFHLKLHREMKEVPVYALVIAKTGSKMRKMADDYTAPTYATRPRERPAVMVSTIPMLIGLISNGVDRPVIDQTELSGQYEYTNLDWGQFGRDKRAGPLDPQSGESIFFAVQQELGLKLEPRKDPVEVLVIDHVEKPTAN
ncbi:conserved exported hypothetical protein [Candidatus Sulfopaludibacter sp. SbA3]|nr:conserved exported hypothetical protein [Candidatus Sulfopaludibacter sp. SbA3]